MLTVIIPAAVSYQAMDAVKRDSTLSQRMKNYEEYLRTHDGDCPKLSDTSLKIKKGVDDTTSTTKEPDNSILIGGDF